MRKLAARLRNVSTDARERPAAGRDILGPAAVAGHDILRAAFRGVARFRSLDERYLAAIGALQKQLALASYDFDGLIAIAIDAGVAGCVLRRDRERFQR